MSKGLEAILAMEKSGECGEQLVRAAGDGAGEKLDVGFFGGGAGNVADVADVDLDRAWLPGLLVT